MFLKELAVRVKDVCMFAAEHEGRLPMVLLVFRGEPYYRFPVCPDYRSRLILWEALAQIARSDKPDAIAYGDIAWSIHVPEENHRHLDEEQRRKIFARGPDFLVEYGFGIRRECLDVTAQSRDMAVSLNIPFERHGERYLWGEESCVTVPQAEMKVEMNLMKFYRYADS